MCIRDSYYHSKLLSDGLLNYTGDTWELADALWEAFDAFQPWMQVTLLNLSLIHIYPTSVEFCHKVGLDYVSCSPFRVPIARLAAAQAAIKEM